MDWKSRYDKLSAEHARLLAFAGAILKAHRGDGPEMIGDIDGGEFEELCCTHGFLELRTVTAPCGAICSCDPSEEEPAQCYFLTPLGEFAIAALNPEPL